MADISFSAAAAAYANGAVRAATAAPAASPPLQGEAAARAGPSFAELVQGALGAAREAGVKAEADGLRALAGTASLNEVVASVANAEVTLQTVIAVRDRVIAAYQDILRMPI